MMDRMYLSTGGQARVRRNESLISSNIAGNIKKFSA